MRSKDDLAEVCWVDAVIFLNPLRGVANLHHRFALLVQGDLLALLVIASHDEILNLVLLIRID